MNEIARDVLKVARELVSGSLMPSESLLHRLGELPTNKWGALIARDAKLIKYWKHLLKKARASGHPNPHADALIDFKESVTSKSKDLLANVALDLALEYGDTELVDRIENLDVNLTNAILHESLEALNSISSIGSFVKYLIKKFDKNIR
jgi:hypothetical protein